MGTHPLAERPAELMVHPECEAGTHARGFPGCVCPTRREKERAARGEGRIPETDPRTEARFNAMPEEVDDGTRLEADLLAREDLACRREDPELFFVIGGKSGNAKLQEAVARAVCRRCPAEDDCLTVALKVGDPWSVRGGTTPAERRGMRAQMRGAA